MHYNDVHETLYIGLKFMAPGPGVQAFGQGQYGHIVKMHKILENLLYSHIYLRRTTLYVHDDDVHEAVYLTCKFDDPLFRGSGPMARAIMAI